ncbi:hypothetical protein MTO96_033852 [Rhipicephalus appendiculatus]
MISLGATKARCSQFAAVTVLIMLVAMAVVQARCPYNRPGLFSNCAYTECTPAECAASGLECCPKPCGGSWCVKGTGPPSENPEICPPAFSWTLNCPVAKNNATCEQLNCSRVGSICCRNGCKENYCYQIPGTAA